MNATAHSLDCPCYRCQRARVQRRMGREDIFLGFANSTANGIAYAVFGLVVLVVLLFVIRWAYTEYWVTTHCTEVLATRVCRLTPVDEPPSCASYLPRRGFLMSAKSQQATP